MSTESRKKKLQQAGKSHFFFTFSRLSFWPAWKGKDTGHCPHGGHPDRRERETPMLAPLLCLRFAQTP